MGQSNAPAVLPIKTAPVQKSPHWDEVAARSEAMLPGQLIAGFPFNEGIPHNREAVFEIILRDNTRQRVWVDFTTQYRAEGLQWENRHGTWGKHIVAAWRMLD